MSIVEKLNAVKFSNSFPNITKEYLCGYKSHKFITKDGKEFCFMDMNTIDENGSKKIYYLPLWNVPVVKENIDLFKSTSYEKIIIRTIRREDSKYPSYTILDIHESEIFNSDEL